MRRLALLALLLLAAASARAEIDLVTLPTRASVQLTIYNSADLTLVREQRALTLNQGRNRLQFSWAGTLIDPTSLELLPQAHAEQITVAALDYPPRTKNLGQWLLQSQVAGQAPFVLSYFTSGISWRACYQATLSADERTLRLQGDLRITNNSGEDYENAQTRVIVGQVHLRDEIARLAQQPYPYGSPLAGPLGREVAWGFAYSDKDAAKEGKNRGGDQEQLKRLADTPKEVKQEGLSEYFLYTIAGTETIPTGWSKRLPSIDVAAIPVENLYKYEEERYGTAAVRFLYCKNDAAHQLGKTPLPNGALTLYRGVDAAAHLSYEGRADLKYIPVGQEVELSLGAVANVLVAPKVMAFSTTQHTFDQGGNVNGWDEVREYKVEVKNTRDVPVRVAITRNLGTPYWTLAVGVGFDGKYEQVDARTVKFTLQLPPRTVLPFTYTLTTRMGARQTVK